MEYSRTTLKEPNQNDSNLVKGVVYKIRRSWIQHKDFNGRTWETDVSYTKVMEIPHQKTIEYRPSTPDIAVEKYTPFNINRQS